MTVPLRQYLVVVGGSYVGTNVAKELASRFAGRFHVLLIEKNSHFQHLFAFPRFAVTSGVATEKAFIPYSPGTFAACPPGSGTVLQACVTGVSRTAVQLDRKVVVDGREVDEVPYAFLIVATGTNSTPPSRLPEYPKREGIAYFHKHAQQVARSRNIVVIGGGAVGIQMATDIKELYPDKTVTIVHSRDRVMNNFHPGLDRIVQDRCKELGIEVKLGSRVKLPVGGYPNDGNEFVVECQDGTQIPAELAIVCTGQAPQSVLIQAISPSSVADNGFIRVRKTLQITDPEFPNIFALGDVADTGAAKAAKPALRQATVVVNNIQHLLDNELLEEYEVVDPPGIHLTLGITKSVAFGNPITASSEPFTKHKDDGRLDMGIDRIWNRKGGGPDPNL